MGFARATKTRVAVSARNTKARIARSKSAVKLKKTVRKIRRIRKRPAFKPKVGVAVTADHEHQWIYKWPAIDAKGHSHPTYRTCFCGQNQWRLACWTADDWRSSIPMNLKAYRPDVSPALNEGANEAFAKFQHLSRHFDILRPDKLHEPIYLIGAGAIGSFLALALVKMGFTRIQIWDHDMVSEENASNQLYSRYREGQHRPYKMTALMQTLGINGYLTQSLNSQGNRACAEYRNQTVDFTGNAHFTTENEPHFLGICRKNFIQNRYDGQVKLNGIVISCVDSMEARKTIWEAQKGNKDVDWFIDGRMAAEQALMYCMDPNDKRDVKAYEKTLYTDAEASQDRCTAQSTVYTAFLIAGMMAKCVKDLVMKNANYPRVMHWNITDNVQQVWTNADRVALAQQIAAAEENEEEMVAIPNSVPAAEIPDAIAAGPEEEVKNDEDPWAE